jgi:hypothetical protein
VKRSTVSIVVVALMLTLLCGACRHREKSAARDAATQTIEPAKPQPDATDTATLTQTVDVEAGRSEVEGRTANGAEISTAGGTTATAPPATANGTMPTNPAPPPGTTTTR